MKTRITKTLALLAAFCGLQLFTATPAMAGTNTPDENGIVPQMWFKFDELPTGAVSSTEITNYGASGNLTLTDGSGVEVSGGGKAWTMGTAGYQPSCAKSGQSVNSTTYAIRINLNGATYSNKAIWSCNGKAYGGLCLVANGNPTDGYTIKLNNGGSGIGTTYFTYTVPAEKKEGYHWYVITTAGQKRYSSAVYVDGVLVGSPTDTGNWYSGQNEYICLGKTGGNGSTSPATGVLIDDFRNYSKVLTPGQIANISGGVASGYDKFINNPSVFTWGGGSGNFHAGNYYFFSLATGADTSTSINGDTSTTIVPGKEGTSYDKAWKIFASNQTAYTAPGSVLRLATDKGTSNKSMDAQFNNLAFGGMIVESGASGYSFTSTATSDRSTWLGDQRTSGGIDTWFIFNESFTFARGGAGTTAAAFKLYGAINFDIAASKSVTLQKVETNVSPTLNSGAALKMHGEGQIEVNTLTATGSVTLDYTDLATRSSTEPYIKGTVSIDDSTVIKLPATVTAGNAYKMATAISGPTSGQAKLRTIYVGGVELQKAVTFDNANGTITYADNIEYNATISDSTGTKNLTELNWDKTFSPTALDVAIITIKSDVTGEVVLNINNAATLKIGTIKVNCTGDATLKITGGNPQSITKWDFEGMKGRVTFDFPPDFAKVTKGTYPRLGLGYAYTGTIATGYEYLGTGNVLTLQSFSSGCDVVVAGTGTLTGDLDVYGNGTVVLGGTYTSPNNDVKLATTMGTLTISEGADISVTSICLVNSGNTSNSGIFNINGKLTVTSTCGSTVYGSHGNHKGILFGHYYGSSTVTVGPNGQLIGENTWIQLTYTAASSLTINGGTVKVLGLNIGSRDDKADTPVTVKNGGTLELKEGTSANTRGVYSFNGGTLKAWGDYTFAGKSVTLTGGATVDTAGHAITLSNAMSGEGALTKTGAGTLTLSGANIYAGTTTVSGGTLKVEEGASIGTGNYTVNAGGTLNLPSTFRPTTSPALVASSTGIVGITLTASELETFNVGSAFTLDIPVSGDTLSATIKVYDLQGGGHEIETPTISGGKLQIQKKADAKNPPFNVTNPTTANWTEAGWKDSTPDNPQTVVFADWDTTVGANITLASGTTTLTADRDLTLATLDIGNAGTLSILPGSHTMTATAIDDSDSTGTTTIGFAPGAANVTAGANTILSGTGTGTLTINTDKQATVPAWSGSNLSGAGTIVYHADALATAVAPGAFSGNFTGNIRLEKGTWTCSGNYPKTRPVTLSGSDAKFILTQQDGMGYDNDLPAFTVENGATFQANARDTFNRNLILNNGHFVCLKDDNNSGRTFDFYGSSGALTVSGASTIGGVTPATTSNSGILSVRRDNFVVTVDADSTLTCYSQWRKDQGNGNFTKAGTGTWEQYRDAHTSATFAFTLSAGTLKLINGGEVTKSSMALSEGATLELNATDAGPYTAANTISGSGVVTKTGTGTYALTGTISAPITVSVGTLKLAAGQASGTVTLGDDTTLDVTGPAEQSEYVITTGTFNKGNGTVLLNGAAIPDTYELVDNKIVSKHVPTTLYAPADASLTIDNNTLFATTQGGEATTKLGAGDTLVVCNTQTVIFNQTVELAAIAINGSGVTVTVQPGTSAYNFDGQNVSIVNGTLKLEGTIKVRNTVFDIGANGNLDNYGWLTFEGTVTLNSDSDKAVLNNSGFNASHIQGSGTIVKGGSGKLTLKSTPETAITINAGTLVLSPAYGGAAYSCGAITGSGTLELTSGVIVTPTSIATAITGVGTVVLSTVPSDGAFKTSLTQNTWTGTLAIVGYTTKTEFKLAEWGNASSTVRLSGVNGYLTQDGTFDGTLELIDNGSTAALTINDGYNAYKYNLAHLKGGGKYDYTWSGSAQKTQHLYVSDASEFAGSIALGSTGSVTIGATSGGAAGKLNIAQGATVTLASGKTWSADNGIVVNGTLNNNGTLTGTVTGSGTIVYDYASYTDFPTAPTGLNAETWTGTVWVKKGVLAGTELSNYCNDNSKLKFTDVAGWFYNTETEGKCLQGVADLVLENAGETIAFQMDDSSSDRIYSFAKFTGSGSFKCATKASSSCAVEIRDVSDFTGALLSKAGTHHDGTTATAARPIYVGTIADTTGAAASKSLISVMDGVTIRSGCGWEAAEVAFGATLTVKGAANDVIVSGVTTAPTLSTVVTLVNPTTGETESGTYELAYDSVNQQVKVVEVTATHLGWDAAQTAWTNAEGTVVTTITNDHILDAKAGDNISFSTAAAPHAFNMPETGTVTINNQNNLTVTAIDIPAEATLVLGSNAAPGFGVTGTGTLKYGTGSDDANIVTATQLANFHGTFWMASGRHKYSEAIASTVTVKVTDGAVLWLNGGSWANRFEISGQGWKKNKNNSKIEYCAVRFEGDYIADGATINFTTVGDVLPAIGKVGGTITLGCTLTGNGFAKFGSANLVMRNLANYSTLTGTVAIDYGNLTIGNNAAGTAKIGDVLQMNADSTLTLDMATTDNYSNIIASELKPNGCTITLDDGSYKFSRINVTGTGSTISPIYDKLQKIEYLTGDGELTLTWRSSAYGSKPYTIVAGDFTGTVVATSDGSGYKSIISPEGTALAAGTLTLGNNSGITLTTDATIGTLNGNGNAITGSNNAVLTLKGGSSSGVISGAMGLIVAGDVTLSGANTYTGTTTVSSGSLVLSGSGTIGTGNYSVASGATLNLGQVRPTGKLLASSQGMFIIRLQNTAEEEGAFNTGAQVKLLDVEGSPFEGKVTIIDATGAERKVGTVAVVDGKLAVTKSPDDKVPPFRTSMPNGDWTVAGWTDSSSTHVAITGDDWTNQVSAVIDANGTTSTLTTDRPIHLGEFMVTNANTLTISANDANTLTVEEFALSNTGALTLSGNAITATTINDSASTGATTIGFDPGAAAITAGANTILTTLGTGNLTIAAEKTLTVKSDGLVATKVSNSGTLNFQGGSEVDPIDIAGDSNFGTVTLEENTYVKNTVTDNRAHVVTGQGASSWYILNRTDAGVGFISPAASALTNLTLVSDCGNNQRVWIERVVLKDVRLLAKTTFHLNGMSPTVLALAGSGEVTRAGTTETLTINPVEDCTYAGASSVPFTIGGTAVQTFSGAYTGALTINEGGTCALEGDTVEPSSITANGTLKTGTRPNLTVSGLGTVEVTLTAAEYAPGVSTKLFTAGDTTPSIVLKDSEGKTIPSSYYTLNGTTVTFKKEATDGTIYYFTLKQAIETQSAAATIALVKDVTDAQAITVAQNITLEGDTNILENVTFSFDSGALTFNSGCIGVAYATGMNPASSICRFNSAVQESWTGHGPTDYVIATLSTPVRADTTYQYEFVKSSFVPDPSKDEELIPVVDQNDKDAGAIKLNGTWVAKKTGKSTAAEQAIALNTKENNGLMNWQNEVLGLTGSDKDSKPVVHFSQNQSKEGTIAFKLDGVDTTSGATVKFMVYSADTPGASATWTAASKETESTAAAEVALPTTAEGVKYYKYVVTPATSK